MWSNWSSWFTMLHIIQVRILSASYQPVYFLASHHPSYRVFWSKPAISPTHTLFISVTPQAGYARRGPRTPPLCLLPTQLMTWDMILYTTPTSTNIQQLFNSPLTSLHVVLHILSDQAVFYMTLFSYVCSREYKHHYLIPQNCFCYQMLYIFFMWVHFEQTNPDHMSYVGVWKLVKIYHWFYTYHWI